jgi:hypothetical protein
LVRKGKNERATSNAGSGKAPFFPAVSCLRVPEDCGIPRNFSFPACKALAMDAEGSGVGGGGAGSASTRQAGCSGQVVEIRAGWFNRRARAGFLEFRSPQGAARVSRDANPLPAISFDLR